VLFPRPLPRRFDWVSPQSNRERPRHSCIRPSVCPSFPACVSSELTLREANSTGSRRLTEGLRRHQGRLRVYVIDLCRMLRSYAQSQVRPVGGI
jgi:hypothetical protein